MALAAGTKLGQYEIVGLIGAGGMGEVYRARDSKLKRDVAIKALPEEFSRDYHRVSRFQREAEVLASLNHSNIASIYDLQEVNGSRFLVMELVEGETLAERIAEGPLPIEEALDIAKQVCKALEAAHEKGIIHRDLKPGNIKILSDGKVKVLDFGLAKALESGGANMGLSQSPTLSVAATNAGIILGTAAYMSPEQAKARTADKRSDIWAFGVVMYEMLTGRIPFSGETASETMAAVMMKEPDWNALPRTMPLHLRDLLRRCLVKDPRNRLRDIGDARIAIEEVHSGSEIDGHTAPKEPRGRERLAWIFALTAATLIAVVFGIGLFRSASDAPEIRTEIVASASTLVGSFTLSPDGRQLVFVGSGGGPRQLWIRPLAGTAAQPVAGTEGAFYPFWSPDSRSIGFFAEGKLKRVDASGGSLQVLANAVAGRGGTWNADGVILFAPSNGTSLFRVSALGSEPAVVTRLDRQGSQRFPQFLPDGRQFLFYAQGSPETAGIYLGSLDSGETKRLTAADTAAVYAPSGWIFWTRSGTLVAQRLEVAKGLLTGNPITVAGPVDVDVTNNVGAFSVSGVGLLAFRSGGRAERQLNWFDRTGKALGTLGAPDGAALMYPSISPDGRRVAVQRTVQNNTDIWLQDGARMGRFTFDAASDQFPVWSPDGNRIVFETNPKGIQDLYIKTVGGSGDAEPLLATPRAKYPTDWSRDGQFLLYTNIDPQTNRDLWVLPMSGAREAQDRKPWLFLKTEFDEAQAQFSPDGRWVAYQSNESGRWEIYVRPFVVAAVAGLAGNRTGGQWQVSTAGGIVPRWGSDGKELYYIAPDSRMMSAPITVTGAVLAAGTPVALFETRIYGGGTYTVAGRQYDLTYDGRFLINTVVDDTATPITLLQNWRPPAK